MAWKWGFQRSWPEAFFSRLSALRSDKKIIERSGSCRNICHERIKESLWDQGNRLFDFEMTCAITPWILLHSVQLLSLSKVYTTCQCIVILQAGGLMVFLVLFIFRNASLHLFRIFVDMFWLSKVNYL